jgi:regulator of RNase E activity RraA
MNSSVGDETDAVARLARLDTCALSDALDKLELSGVVTGLHPLGGSGRVAGRAVTVRLGTGSPPAGPPRHLGTTAIEAAQQGDIIVIEHRSGVEAGGWGGILTLGAKLRGVAGVVVDGPVRDVDEARAHSFPVFARSCTARTARGRIVEINTNAAVLIGDATVRPGDYVLADASAVVFVSAERIEEVLAVAEAIASREAAMADALRAGRPITEVMGADYEHMLGQSGEGEGQSVSAPALHKRPDKPATGC